MHGQVQVYANISIRSMRFCFLFLMLETAFLPACSQSTVTNDLPSGCMLLQSSYQLIGEVIGDDRSVLAWRRLWNDQKDMVVQAYFCKNAGLSAIPEGVTANAEAIYIDENDIANVRKIDIVPSSDGVTVEYPTLAVSLCSNQISSIEGEVFGSLPKLRLLALKNNSLDNLQWTVTRSPAFETLVELDLSMNQIAYLREEEFGSFPGLRRLDLSDNRIRRVDGTIFSKLPKLEYLDLSSNRITERDLTPSDNTIQSLRFLSVADNLLRDFRTSHFAKFLRKLPSLRTLDMSLNELSSGIIPKEAFYGFSSVRTLNLSRSGIKNFERGWLGGGLSKSLKILDLSHNLLETISADDFALQTKRVQSETLEEAKSEFTNDSLSRNTQLGNVIEVLFLNENYRLSSIEDDAFNSVPNLKLLFLQNCALRRFNIASVKYRHGADPIAATLPLLTNVWIFGNPVSCDCYVRFLKAWSVSIESSHQKKNTQIRYIDAPFYTIDSQTRVILTEFAICVVPESLAGLPVQVAPEKSMTCQEEPYSTLVAMLIGPLTFAGSVALTILCGSLHVCIARMKRGAVLSYHARGELMRNLKVRHRRSHAQPILSTFGWRHSHDDLSSHITGCRSGRHTNLILGNFEGHHRREASRARNRLSPEIASRTSSASFHVDERRDYSRTHSTGYCSGTDTARNESHQYPPSPQPMSDGQLEITREVRKNGSDADSVLENESIHTRTPSKEIPFIDEKCRFENDKSPLGKLSSSSNASRNSSRTSLLSGERGTEHKHLGEELRLRRLVARQGSITGQNSPHHIPGLSPSGRPSLNETSF